MKIAPTLPISLLSCIPFSLAVFDFGSPGTLGDLIPRDLRTSWQTLRELAPLRSPRHRLRRTNTPQKCQLRLVHDHKSTSSPSPTHTSTRTFYTIPTTIYGSTSEYSSIVTETLVSSTGPNVSPTSSTAPRPSSPYTLKQLHVRSGLFASAIWRLNSQLEW